MIQPSATGEACTVSIRLAVDLFDLSDERDQSERPFWVLAALAGKRFQAALRSRPPAGLDRCSAHLGRGFSR